MTKMKYFSSVIYLLGILIRKCISQDDWDCVSSCKCLWISGKKTAECKNQNFSEIPDFVSKEIQHLDLTGNNIKQIPEKVFTRIKLENLQKLILRDCNIRIVHSEAFNGLRIVIEIDLSSNSIRQLQPGTFDQTERLRVLLLNHNRLQKLENELFHDLVYLQKIELSDNHLIEIGQYTFRNLPGLQTLTLDGNNLSSLNMKSFDGLSRLGSLELRKNPWNCDCHLRLFRDWAIQNKLYTHSTSCEKPLGLRDHMWDEVSSEEFACIPKIEQIGAIQCGDAGIENAHFWCHAIAIPKPEIIWVHRRQILTNSTKRHRSRRTYLVHQNDEWANLTVTEFLQSDTGEYVCIAKNVGGSVQKNVSLVTLGEKIFDREHIISLPLLISFIMAGLVFILAILTLCFCYNWRRNIGHTEKISDVPSVDQLELAEQEKSLITAINPVVKPPRRYESSSVISYSTELTQINKNLLDNESTFANGASSVMGLTSIHCQCSPPIVTDAFAAKNGFVKSIDNAHGSHIINSLGTLSRNHNSCQSYPPDLLSFSRRHNISISGQNSKLFRSPRKLIQPSVVGTQFSLPPSRSKIESIFTTCPPIRFKTLPQPVRTNSVKPYNVEHLCSSTARNVYGTLPRRLRAPSWSSSSPTCSFEQEMQELMYDNLGVRSTADGSSILSLNKNIELRQSIRGKFLPLAPITVGSLIPNTEGIALVDVPPSTILTNQQSNRAAPEGAIELTQLIERRQQRRTSSSMICSLLRKVPPRPPPKPKTMKANAPLYEDESEDGTEV